MPKLLRLIPAGLCALLVCGTRAHGQFPTPRLQSVVPAGGQAGESVDVTIGGTDIEGVNALWFDHPGLRAFHLKGQTFRVAIAPGVPVGQHDLRLVSPLGISNPRVFVVGDQPEKNEAEPNNLPGQANPIVPGTVVNGSITATDIDCFQFDGKKGERIAIELWASRIDSRLDAMIRLYDPKGVEIIEGHRDVGADPFLDIALPADGKYTIKLHDVIYAGSAEYFYRLQIGDRPHIDAVLPAAAPSGVAGTFTVYGRNLGGERVPELKVEGRPLERKEVTLTSPAPGDDASALVPGLSTWLSPWAARRGFTFNAWGPGGRSNPAFVAEANEPVLLEHEPNDDETHAQTITLPIEISGTFGQVGDRDIYRFQGKKGETYRIEALAEQLGSPADPSFLIQRVGDKGALQDLASGDDLGANYLQALFATASVDATLGWQVPEDGTYQIVVSDIYNTQRGDPRLVYHLRIRKPRPDFALFVVPTNPTNVEGVNLRAGGRAILSVITQRFDGMNRPIRIEPVELPPGVTCEPSYVQTNNPEVPFKVTPVVLEAAANAKPTEGRVRLIGRSLSADRKDLLDFSKNGVGLYPEQVHEAIAAGMIWPMAAPNGQPTPAPARLNRGMMVAVREGAPFRLDVKVAHWDVMVGTEITLKVDVTRHAGFTEAVQLVTSDLPPGMPAVGATIPKDKTSAEMKLAFSTGLPTGTYTILVQGTGPFPFSKDPNAKQKPNINVSEPSNPITLTLRR